MINEHTATKYAYLATLTASIVCFGAVAVVYVFWAGQQYSLAYAPFLLIWRGFDAKIKYGKAENTSIYRKKMVKK